MKEKIKSALEETSYSKTNVSSLLVIVGIVIVIGFFLTLPESDPEPEQETKPPTASNDPGRVRYSSWKNFSGPVIPVGVWSEWNGVSPGCNVDFGFDKEIHRVQYRYYTREILEYQDGTSPNLNSFRIMFLEEGHTEAPYLLTCR
ncbi:hypothetical protein ACFL07_05915 [Pseudomonadota bacterium]